MSAFVKRILAGETVTGRHRYGQTFEMKCRALHVFATNELPRTQDKSGAIERRAMVVHFPRSLSDSEVDPAFLARVANELPGVVAWAAAGFERAMQRGSFTLPPGHKEAMVQMQHQGDGVAIFAHLHLEKAPGARVTTADLKAALRAFAREQDFDPVTIASDGSMRRMATLIERLYGGRRSRTNNAPYYEGVRFRGAPRSCEPGGDEEMADL